MSHSINLKRSSRVIYSSDSDESYGPLPIKPKLDCTPFTLEVSEEDESMGHDCGGITCVAKIPWMTLCLIVRPHLRCL